MIEVLHIPHDLSQPVRVVRINERNVISYYPYLSGGPAEGVPVAFEGAGEHVVYVNARYTQIDEAKINLRVTALLESSFVRMALGGIRGDALLVRSAGDGDYERSITPGLAHALSDD